MRYLCLSGFELAMIPHKKQIPRSPCLQACAPFESDSEWIDINVPFIQYEFKKNIYVGEGHWVCNMD